MLKSVKHTGMRDSNERLGILFYRNDPQLLEGTHGHPYPFKTSRKPDVVVVSLQAAKRVLDLEGGNDGWDLIARDAAVTDPPSSFKTYEVISCNEEKYTKEINPNSLNLSDLAKMPPPVPPQNDVSSLLNYKKRVASLATQSRSPTAKRQKTDGW